MVRSDMVSVIRGVDSMHYKSSKHVLNTDKITLNPNRTVQNAFENTIKCIKKIED